MSLCKEHKVQIHGSKESYGTYVGLEGWMGASLYEEWYS